jgi:hypothetical protein
MTLDNIFERAVIAEAHTYSYETRERVEKVLTHEGKCTPYRFLETIEDFKLYHSMHPEWEGIKISQVTGKLGSFYAALRKWANENSDSQKEKTELIRQIFPTKQKNWKDMTTLEDWKEYHSRNKEWENLPIVKLIEIKEGRKFYDAFGKWARQQGLSNAETYGKIFEKLTRDYNHLKTIDDWEKYHSKRKEWKNLSAAQIQDEIEHGGYAFYTAFTNWTHENSEDEKERKEIVKQIFPSERIDWALFTTLDDWLNYYQDHKEWKGLNTGQIREDPKGRKFYKAYAKWIKNVSKNENERISLKRILFPEQRAPFTYDHSGQIVHYDSSPERIVGILLEEYGLLENPQEGINIHIRTNGNKRNSIDFLVEECFIEYHPQGLADKKAGRTLEESGQRKKDNITNPEYEGFDFVHIWDIEQLYTKFLRKSKIKRKIKKNLTKKQFEKDVRNAFEKAFSHDITHPKKKKQKKKKVA